MVLDKIKVALDEDDVSDRLGLTNFFYSVHLAVDELIEVLVTILRPIYNLVTKLKKLSIALLN